MAEEFSSLDQLKTAIDGKTDEEIYAGVAERGTDVVLGQIFGAMAGRFQPDKAAGQNAVIGWDIKTPEGVHKYQLKVDGGSCECMANGTDPARVTLQMALPDFLRLITGQLDGMSAFMTGKLALAGDMMFAQAFQSWFASS